MRWRKGRLAERARWKRANPGGSPESWRREKLSWVRRLPACQSWRKDLLAGKARSAGRPAPRGHLLTGSRLDDLLVAGALALRRKLGGLRMSRRRPFRRELLRLFEHRLRRLLLLVRRVAVLAQNSLHQHPKLRVDVLPDSPGRSAG